MTDGTQSHGWVFYLGLGLSLTIHGGVAVYLLSRDVADFGATDVTTTAISVNIEATDIVDAAEQSAATDAAQRSASRPAPVSDAKPGQADTPEPEPARAETVPPQCAPDTAQAEPTAPPAGRQADEAAASPEVEPASRALDAARKKAEAARHAADEAALRALNAVREKDEAARRPGGEAAPPRAERKAEAPDAATERRAERARQADKQTKDKRTPRAANAEANGAAGAKASAGRVSASQGAMQTYKGVLDAWMARHKPAYAGGRGRVEMLIALSPSGALISASIVSSSGNRALDQAALGAARRASPYPKPPPGSTDAQRRFRVPFASN